MRRMIPLVLRVAPMGSHSARVPCADGNNIIRGYNIIKEGCRAERRHSTWLLYLKYDMATYHGRYIRSAAQVTDATGNTRMTHR
jgi:hypothetical protein